MKIEAIKDDQGKIIGHKINYDNPVEDLSPAVDKLFEEFDEATKKIREALSALYKNLCSDK